MNHLYRELAPISDAAWAEIEAEAKRSLANFLAARRLVDFKGPQGWDTSAIGLGRTQPIELPMSGRGSVYDPRWRGGEQPLT